MRKSKLISLFALSSFFLSLMTFDEGMQKTVSTQEFPTEANIGDVVSIPNKILEYNGQSKEASIRVHTPDNGVYTGNSFIAEAGKYVVEYYADFSGSEIKETKEITVNTRGIDLFGNVNNATLEYGANPRLESQKGVIAEVSPGSSFMLNKLIDVTKLDENTPIIDMIALPHNLRSNDLEKIYINLEEVGNEDNKLSISLTACDNESARGVATYVKAGGPGQTPGGWEGSTWHTYYAFGCPLFHSFQGWTYLASREVNYNLKLFYDYKTNSLIGSERLTGSNLLDGLGKTEIACFSDTKAFGNNLWGGFNGKYVRLSVSFDQFDSDTAKILFMNLGGIDLRKEKIEYKVAPKIDIDYGEDACAYNAETGKDYEIFPASAVDYLNDEVEVTNKVRYQNISTGEYADVSVQSGKFHLGRAGKYFIEYKAKDKYGNESKENAEFYCFDKLQDLEIVTLDVEQDVHIFDKVQIKGLDSTYVTGGSGQKSISMRLINPKNGVITLNENYFIPDIVGTYYLVYSATDRLSKTATKYIEIKARQLENTIISVDETMPKALLDGFVYGVPSASAIEPVGDDSYKRSQADVFVNDEKISGNKYSAKKNDEGNNVFRFAYKEASETMAVPCFDSGNGYYQENYFYSADSSVTAMAKDSSLNIAAAKDGGSFFVNQLDSSYLQLTFEFQAQYVNFDYLDFKFIDAKDESKTITFFFSLKSGVSLKVPGSDYFKPFESTYNNGVYQIRFAYDNVTGLVYDTLGSVCDNVAIFDDGNTNTGLSEGSYLSISFENVRKQSEIDVISLNLNPFGKGKATGPDNYRERVRPTISESNLPTLRYMMNDKLELEPLVAFDVLSYIKTFTLSILKPNGELKSDLDPASSNIVDLDQCGEYLLTYTAIDSSNNTFRKYLSVMVEENNPPKITANFNSINSAYSLGSSVRIPDIKVEDDSSDYQYTLYLRAPSNALFELRHCSCVSGLVEMTNHLSEGDDDYPAGFVADSNSFKVLEKGRYELFVIAYDAYFNVSSLSATFMGV